MVASDDALLRLASEVGEVRGGIDGLHKLIETAVVARLDEHLDMDRQIHEGHERRLTALEAGDNTRKGEARANMRWSAAGAGVVTLLFNGALALISRALAH